MIDLLYDYDAETLKNVIFDLDNEIATNCVAMRIPVTPRKTKTSYECPRCGWRLKGRRSQYANPNFCSECGQRIGWTSII